MLLLLNIYVKIIHMKIALDNRLISLAKSLDKPLYAVGGIVRNYLLDGSSLTDVDLCAPIGAKDFCLALNKYGYHVITTVERTGTVIFSDEKDKYEFTSFRREKYIGGEHTPFETEFTENIKEDALRRDFKCNAVYYDIAKDEIVDILGGVEDIKNKVLDTVTNAKAVFCHDGLRLMRLARFCGELDFTPSEDVILGMIEYANNILEISPERIFEELKKILSSDMAYSFSNSQGHYVGLKILEQTGVLDYIIPELTKGRNMTQRADFHKYDVLEHSLRCVLCAPKEVRLIALLHDVGKPYALEKDGNFYEHAKYGEILAERILNRLRADNQTIKKAKAVIKYHMVDMDCKMKEGKLRNFLVKNQSILDDLLFIKQADYSASKDDLSTSKTVEKWKDLLLKMEVDGTPFSLSELEITAKELIDLGYEGKSIGRELDLLFNACILEPKLNKKDLLLAKARKDFR